MLTIRNFLNLRKFIFIKNDILNLKFIIFYINIDHFETLTVNDGFNEVYQSKLSSFSKQNSLAIVIFKLSLCLCLSYTVAWPLLLAVAVKVVFSLSLPSKPTSI